MSMETQYYSDRLRLVLDENSFFLIEELDCGQWKPVCRFLHKDHADRAANKYITYHKGRKMTSKEFDKDIQRKRALTFFVNNLEVGVYDSKDKGMIVDLPKTGSIPGGKFLVWERLLDEGRVYVEEI